MAWKNSFMALGLLTALLPAPAALAADHQDGAAVLNDPTTDVNDVYSWVSADGSKVYLIMTVYPAAPMATAKFSNAAYYVFHTTSRANFLSMQPTPLDIVCSFDATQKISCWVGDSTHFVYGDASNTAGISSSDGKVTVFAGLRKDHFFFNLDGFKAVVTAVDGISPVPTADTNGCFAKSANNAGGLTPAQTLVVRNQLKQSPAGGNPTDHFLPFDTLAIVMTIDKTLITPGGPIMSVWGATYKQM